MDWVLRKLVGFIRLLVDNSRKSAIIYQMADRGDTHKISLTLQMALIQYLKQEARSKKQEARNMK